MVLFSDYDYSSAILGKTFDDRAIYDYDKMIDYLITEQNFDEESAIEWVDNNTIRSLDSIEKPPIVVYLENPGR